VRRVLIEALAVAVIGAVLAFAANALSYKLSGRTRGIKLSEDHWRSTQASVLRTNAVLGTGAPGADSQAQLEARLKARGLQLVESNKVAELFRDPRRLEDGIVFVDARKPELYEEGHIPGAYLFDRFYYQNYLATVVPACLKAAQVVVYCNGGDCDDSEFAAELLKDAQIAASNLFVYGGGFTEWATNAMPVELGQRNSGQMKSPAPGSK
jgi:rhodanese-related sulfurtransferase